MGWCNTGQRGHRRWVSPILHLDSYAWKLWVEFPWKELGDNATVCDVAGGIGNISLQLAKAHPNLRLILQDLPERIQQAKNEVWPKECPEAIAERRITFEPIDFFASSPVPGCNVYYVRDTYLSSFLPFLTENLQLKNIMCVLILLTIVFGVHNDWKCFPVTTGLTPSPLRSSLV